MRQLYLQQMTGKRMGLAVGTEAQGRPDPEEIKMGLFWRDRGVDVVIILVVLKNNKN